MKENTTRWWAILVAVLVVYNVIVFAAPFPKNAVFFLSWAFTMLAMTAQVYIMRTAFQQGGDIKSKFYSFPIAKVGIMYLAAQLTAGLVFMTSELVVAVPVWIPLILYVVLLGVSAVGLVAVDITRDEVVRQEVKLKKDVSLMLGLQIKAASLPGLTQDKQLVRLLEKFAEAVRYSDPVSCAPLSEIEANLTACVDQLYQVVTDGDYNHALALVQKAGAILTERNRLCKLNKG